MHNEAPSNYTCPLCRFIMDQDQLPPSSCIRDVVASNNRAMAIISVHQWPNNHGNVIVFPVDHFENLYDLPLEMATDVHYLARQVAIAMKEAWSCEGISTRQHNGKAGNQDVWHYHLHVTPRYSNDDFYAMYTSSARIMDPDKRADLAADLRAVIANIDIPAP